MLVYCGQVTKKNIIAIYKKHWIRYLLQVLNSPHFCDLSQEINQSDSDLSQEINQSDTR